MEGARLATVEDVPTIESINDRYRKEIDGQRGAALFLEREAGASPVGPAVERAIDAASAFVVVGTYDDVVFGYGLATVETLLNGDLLARLSDFVVDAEARKSGIGEAMMNLLVELATDAGCIGVDSVALPGDRDTKNFFESFGLKARLLTVHRALDGGDDS